MAVQQRHLYQSLRIALLMAASIAFLYAVGMTARIYVGNSSDTSNPLIVFGLTFSYCAPPLFLLLWPVVALFRRLGNE